jgi:hypothetical protein
VVRFGVRAAVVVVAVLVLAGVGEGVLGRSVITRSAPAATASVLANRWLRRSARGAVARVQVSAADIAGGCWTAECGGRWSVVGKSMRERA